MGFKNAGLESSCGLQIVLRCRQLFIVLLPRAKSRLDNPSRSLLVYTTPAEVDCNGRGDQT